MTVWLHHEGDPPQRVRDELCRAPVAWAVGTPARPLVELHGPWLLDQAGENPGARQIRRDLPRRCPRALRRLWRLARRGAAPRRPGPGQRPRSPDPGDG